MKLKPHITSVFLILCLLVTPGVVFAQENLDSSSGSFLTAAHSNSFTAHSTNFDNSLLPQVKGGKGGGGRFYKGSGDLSSLTLWDWVIVIVAAILIIALAIWYDKKGKYMSRKGKIAVLFGAILLISGAFYLIFLSGTLSESITFTSWDSQNLSAEIVDSHGSRSLIGATGSVAISGNVKNTGNSSLRFVQINATGYDAAGNIVANDETYIDLETLPAGGTSEFTAYLDDPQKRIVSYKLRIFTTFNL